MLVGHQSIGRLADGCIPGRRRRRASRSARWLGVTELFPVSSLGHSVILPALLGWPNVVAAESAAESFFLAFLVGLRVATALALLFFFRADWARTVRGLIRSAQRRKIETSDERLGWLLIFATVPAGLLGLAS